MLAIWNRRELITVPSWQKLAHIREALAAAGIACTVRTRGAARAAERARFGIGGLREEALYSHTVYVHRGEYDRAVEALRSALRNG